MYHEVVSIMVEIPFNNTAITVIETFLAPSIIVKALADFLSCREDEDTFTVMGFKISFIDCSVKVGDSKEVVKSFNTMKRYNLPLTTYNICNDLIQNAKLEENNWKTDNNFISFSEWYIKNSIKLNADEVYPFLG